MGKLSLGKLLLGKMYIWEVAAFPSWGSCHLGKYPWKVAAWEVALGKVSNIYCNRGVVRGRGYGGLASPGPVKYMDLRRFSGSNDL